MGGEGAAGGGEGGFRGREGEGERASERARQAFEVHRERCSDAGTQAAAPSQEFSNLLWALSTLAVDAGPAATTALAGRAVALLPAIDPARAVAFAYSLAATAPGGGGGEKEDPAAEGDGVAVATAAAAVRRVLKGVARRVLPEVEGEGLTAAQVRLRPPRPPALLAPPARAHFP